MRASKYLSRGRLCTQFTTGARRMPSPILAQAKPLLQPPPSLINAISATLRVAEICCLTCCTLSCARMLLEARRRSHAQAASSSHEGRQISRVKGTCSSSASGYQEVRVAQAEGVDIIPACLSSADGAVQLALLLGAVIFGRLACVLPSPR